MISDRVNVIGGGLAGSEAAWQLAKRGIPVRLYEMKPLFRTPAHVGDKLGELVCSNSLRAARIASGPGLLKEEMRRLDSLVMRAADANAVPAGGALAVDREGFSACIDETLRSHPLVEIVCRRLDEIPPTDGITIVATGPLTAGGMTEAIRRLIGAEYLYFYDAAAPIVTAESVDMRIAFRASRYEKGSDYLNCPMNKEQYDAFVDALVSAETAPLELEEEEKVFEGCMPVEAMAARGHMTLAYGPLKPVGLSDGAGARPYAVVQLRQDNKEGTLYNLVGFQTHLKFGEQKRVFSMIPGLEHAEFVRYGVMHRNTFINSPGLLNADYSLKKQGNIYFAGQITGVEGYIESTASGLVAGISAACRAAGLPAPVFSPYTAVGALGAYVAREGVADFQPTNINFGIIRQPELPRRLKKADKYERIARHALAVTDQFVKEEQEKWNSKGLQS
ncbi:MAG: methylenetetrahydrofolate--tRNA-(uracil(54)-C(5))-methyltransferase (FADH(2)-oxidizing) TrmFO [Eubacteriales bacterium]|nr:methylenetetrahydrofolate--tRNA-(uracil(54)-C(5))-methyltransferase (FADH(2)-oxidizing) TrmFO [Eubacteriales bacterium]